MLKLPNVTLIALTNKDFEGHKKALFNSCKGIEWGAVKMIYPIDVMTSYAVPVLDGALNRLDVVPLKSEINNIDDWNKAIIYDLPTYIHTDFALLIHADGYVIHPEKWSNEFLAYDYVGAPWPLPLDNYSYRTASGKIVRVGNSVSLRSKRLMELVATRPMKFHYGNNNEDGQICCWERDWLESQGCKFAPLSVAIHFSKEHSIPENEGIETFAFHSV